MLSTAQRRETPLPHSNSRETQNSTSLECFFPRKRTPRITMRMLTMQDMDRHITVHHLTPTHSGLLAINHQSTLARDPFSPLQHHHMQSRSHMHTAAAICACMFWLMATKKRVQCKWLVALKHGPGHLHYQCKCSAPPNE